MIEKNEFYKFKNTLNKYGYKLTPQREAIINIFIQKNGSLLTVEELYKYVKAKFSKIGLSTVYRTVLLLYKSNIICKLNFDDGCTRYELTPKCNTHQHHYLICNHCNKIVEIEEDMLNGIEQKIEQKYDFKIENHSLNFYGKCKECMNV